ncbi:MAG: dolichyl-phosphate beta-glucosyltransferase [Chloroflexota bacterium]
MTSPFLSIVIPAHNEARRLPGTLEQVFAFLQGQDYSAEVLVVENGSRDDTYEIALRYAAEHPGLRVLQETISGKGRAVRRGMLEARGQYRFMCDADLSMPITELPKFVPAPGESLDIAIASREAPGAVRHNEPQYRHLGGRLINLAIRTLILPGLNDTQCGFKCFRAEVADDIFEHQTIPGWSFDIELLYIARKRGYRIAEIPIHWYFDAETKLRAVEDALVMLRDIFLIHRNALRGLYAKKD